MKIQPHNTSGIWIKKSILQNEKLNSDEKLVYAVIDYFIGNGIANYTWVYNETISDMVGIPEPDIEPIIVSLEKKEIIRIGIDEVKKNRIIW